MQDSLFDEFPIEPEKPKYEKIKVDKDFKDTHLPPKEFGSYFGLSDDTIINRIEKGIIKAVNLNPGGVKARYEIHVDEIAVFREKIRKDRFVVYRNLD